MTAYTVQDGRSLLITGCDADDLLTEERTLVTNYLSRDKPRFRRLPLVGYAKLGFSGTSRCL